MSYGHYQSWTDTWVFALQAAARNSRCPTVFRLSTGWAAAQRNAIRRSKRKRPRGHRRFAVVVSARSTHSMESAAAIRRTPKPRPWI